MMASFQRSNSHDKVRRIVAEEGRTARNLIAWSVPLESKDDDGKSKCQAGGKSKRTIQGTHKTTKQHTAGDCKITSSTTGEKHFDKSPTKTRHPRKIDLRARYWAFLFDNLRRAVDEIYVTCESDQSVVECKEVLMMLDNYVRDFKALIDWIQLQEKLEKTDAQSRPTSLAWEVKKMSPGRPVIASPSTDRISAASNARRSLNFGASPGAVAAPRLAPTGVSWADKVKAHHTVSTTSPDAAPAQSCSPMTVQKTSCKNERKDAEGWETVQRGRPVRSRSAAAVPKVSAPASRSKDDSDKENAGLSPEDSVHRGGLVGDGPRQPAEPRPKDSSHSCDHPLAERTQEHLSLKKYIIDIVVESTAPPEPPRDGEERQKNKKKARKIKARMNSRAKEYESLTETKSSASDSPYKAKLQRLAKDLLKQLQAQDSGSWANTKVSALDRTLGEVARILEKENVADQIAFQVAGGLTALEHVLQGAVPAANANTVSRIPPKSLCSAVNVYSLTCSNCSENCTDVLFSNKITFLMDLLMHQLTVYVPDENNAVLGRNTNKQVFEGLTTGLLRVIAVVFGCLIASRPDGSSQPATPKIPTEEMKNKPSQSDAFNSRVQDLISYVVNVGLIEKLCGCFLSVQGPVDESPRLAALLQHAAGLLQGACTLCRAVTGRSHSIFDSNRQDPTGLTAALQATDLAGVLHMLYCVLFHGTISDPGTASPKESYTQNTVQVAIQSLRFFNSFAALDLPAFQSIVGAEGLSLAFRHIASSLLGHCSQVSCESLLHEVIVCVGYFTVGHPDNQVIVQSGRHPTVLQKLCQLPFQYFSDPRLVKVLFPSLIAACYNNSQNKIILEQEMSCVLLATFIQDFAQNRSQADAQAPQPKGKCLASQDYLELADRFPQQAWEEARQFFLKKEK
ncbi:S-phase cyclin A associated protein in the ER [Phyllostomus discolor]|uniref:S-phase cyclin A associated protein in the ER n=1 Tax=Phyllostomus discolor TaxID=89673 RepID=A0A833YUB2_9CHIR|nr:S-phase cyclin A associated protein in the ER [Phyllostomus discolor]